MKIGLRYIVFVLLIVGLFTSQKLILGTYFAGIPEYEAMINEAGRQRMFSQRFTKDIYLNKLDQQAVFQYDSLNALNIENWENTYIQLMDKIFVLGIKDELLDSLLKTNAKLISQFDQKATQLNRFEIQDAIYLEQGFLHNMENIVTRIQELSAQNVKNVKLKELILSIIFLLATSVLFILFIVPVHNQLKNNLFDLNDANTKLTTAEEELRSNLEYLSALQEELEQKDKLNKIFIDQAPLPIAMLDRQSNILAASLNWLKEYNLTRAGIEKLTFLELNKDSRMLWGDVFNQVINGKTLTHEGQMFESEGGEPFWLKWEMMPWYLAEGEIGGALFYFEDITERRRLELENNRVKNNMEMTNIAAKIGSWELLVEEQKVIWSDVTKQIHEVPMHYDPNLHDGLTFYKEGIHREKIQKALDKAIETGVGWDLDLQILTHKGTAKWIRTIGMAEFQNGRCARLYGTFQDINSSKELELTNKREAIKMENLIKGTNAGTWEWNIKENKLVYNERWAEIIGYKLSELEPVSFKTWEDHVHPDDLKLTNKLLKECWETKDAFYEAEVRMKHKKGHWVYVFTRGKVFSWTEEGEPEMMYGTHLDVSKQRHKQIQFESFIRQTPTAVAMFDKRLRYIAASDKWIHDYNLINKDIIGQSLYDVIPHMSDGWKKSMEKCLSGKRVKGDAAEFFLRDGSKVFVDWEMKPWYFNDLVSGIIVHTEDVTLKKRLEDEKYRIQSVIDLTNNILRVGVWDYNVKHDTIFWSEVTKEMHGVPYDYSPTVEGFFNFFRDDNNTIKKIFSDAKEKGKSFDVEIQIETMTGEPLWVRFIGKPISSNGKCVKVLGIYMDVDDVYRYNTEDVVIKKNRLEEVNHQLLKKNRRLKDFAQITSHNLRAPVSNLNALIELFKMSDDPKQKAVVVDKMATVGNHLNDTLDVLMDSLKLQEADPDNLKKEVLSFERVFEEVMAAIDAFAEEKNVKVTSDFHEVPEITYYKLYLHSILQNLITNGIKYSSPEKESYVHVKTYVRNKVKYLEVSDNGLGIDLDKYGKKVFGLNKTFHKKEGSQGIGLFMTKQQVELLGGEITVESKENIGSKFLVKF